MKIILACALMVPLIAYSQENLVSNLIEFPSELPEEYHVDFDQVSQQMLADFPREVFDTDEELVVRFADNEAYRFSQYMRDGDTYSGWSEAENYLNEVLQKLLEHLDSDIKVKRAYIRQTGDFNAFMTSSGNMFINVGAIAEIENEANLAAILAHELSHYVLLHGLDAKLKTAKDYRYTAGARWTRAIQSRYSINRESQSDSLGTKLLEAAGYTTVGAREVFSISQQNELNRIRRYRRKANITPSTHPLSQQRLEALEAIRDTTIVNGKYYLVNEELFKRINKQAKLEAVYAHLRDFRYYNCMELGFKYHLMDPKNVDYIYCVLESIRMLCYQFPNGWEESFITFRYYQKVDPDFEDDKPPVSGGIFSHFDPEILNMTTAQVANIKAQHYWENVPPFRSFEQAFNFFYRLGRKQDCTECLLSNALSYEKEGFRKERLEKYLEQPDCMQREYAQALLDGELTSSLPERKLISISNLTGDVKLGKNNVSVLLKDDEQFTSANRLVDALRPYFENDTILYLPAKLTSDLPMYRRLKQMTYLNSRSFVTTRENFNLLILQPAFWYAMKHFEANEINFVSANYAEFQKKNKSLEDYKQAANLELAEVLDRSHMTRFLAIEVSGIRCVDNNRLRARYYAGEEKIPFKGTGLVGMEKMLMTAIKQLTQFYK